MYDTVIQIQKEEKVRVNARIPQSLYDWVCSEYDNTSQAINEGLVNLKNSRSGECHTEGIQNDIPELQSVIQEHTSIDKEVQQELKLRIEDLKAQIETLSNQLNTKDGQIETLSENMHKQAVHIQTLIQENSRLNVKLIPENIQAKKLWWKFW